MKLESEFLKLPLRFDADKLAEEALSFTDNAWEYHPQGFEGNSALILVSADGGQNNAYTGPMAATPALEQCPYIRQVLAVFDTVIGRSRLMRLDPGCEVPPHSDVHYSWKNHIRIHIPIVTDPGVIFSSVGNVDVHMEAGDAWIFDNWKQHTVRNDSDAHRIHLVIDTTGTSRFWKLAARSWKPGTPQDDWRKSVDFVKPDNSASPTLQFERFNSMPVLPPAEIDLMSFDFLSEINGIESDNGCVESMTSRLAEFRQDWRSTWSLYGDSPEGFRHYELLISNLKSEAKKLLGEKRHEVTGTSANTILTMWLDSALDPEASKQQVRDIGSAANTMLFDRPIFIVSAPRSGSTMFFEILQQNMELWTIGDESQVEIESIQELHPASHNFDSNILTAADATPDATARLVSAFIRKLKNSQGTVYSQMPAAQQPSGIRFLEKTPKNALRIPFLHKIFSNALFIFLHRSPEQNISSIMEAWNSGKFVTYPKLPGWQGLPWSMLLPHGWRNLVGKPLEEIAAHQWREANSTILRDLAELPDNQWCCVRYEDLIDDRENQLKRICEFAKVPFGPRMQALGQNAVPLSKNTLSKPDPDKWKRHQAAIERVIPGLEDLRARLGSVSMN